jgi:biopolymer transport protein ExbD
MSFGSSPRKSKFRRKPREEIEIPTASLGDVAFNLIAFFLVCSVAMKDVGLKVESPEYRDLTVLKKMPKIIVVLDASGQLTIMGQPTTPEAVKDQLSEMLDGKTDPGDRQVLFKCDKNLDRQVFEPVIGAIAGAGATLVLGGEEPKHQPSKIM